MTLTISGTHDAIEAARRFGERRGPIADLVANGAPACFAHLRPRLSALRREAFTAGAALNMEDGPDDPFMERGKQEIADIHQAVDDLDQWVQHQQCAPHKCECRADRLLRRLLEAENIATRDGFSPSLRRVTCVIAAGTDPDGAGHVLVEHRNNIDHQVRLHRGWRARMRTPHGLVPVYQSPGYPTTSISDYRDDTRACVRAVAEALASRTTATTRGN